MKLMDKAYYDSALAKGIDLNFYGDWQKNYAKMIVHCSNILPIAANNQKESVFLDVGTACGLIVRAIKELKIFANCFGIDINPYMIELGRKTHNLSEDELLIGDAKEIPTVDNSITFLHCAQVLEHIDEEDIPNVLNEFYRIISKDGIILITVPTVGSPEDSEHVTIKDREWWSKKFKKHGFKLDPTINLRFSKSKFSPDNSDKNFHHYYKDFWYVFSLRKEV